MRWKDEPVALPLRDVSALLMAHAQLHERIDAAAPPLVVIARGALDAALAHVAASRVERGGLLVGEPFVHERGAGIAAVLIRHAVPSDAETGDAISLRMEASVWQHAHAALRESERVVGWFHSHPGIGAFFSGTDRRTQAAFFAQAFSLGWVIDPIRGEHAWFVGGEAADVVESRVLVLE
jgi:proteasome lid subunit RPN8/RPN11